SQVRESGQVVHDLFPHTQTEIVELLPAAVIHEREDAHRVSADQRRRDRPLRHDRDLPRLEDRRIAAFWQIDDHLIAAAVFLIVANELRPQSTSLDSDDGIGSGIEGWLLVEHVHTDHVLFELGAAAADRFEHDEAEEALEAIDLLE